MQIMKRTDVTEMVVMAKIKKGLSWTKIAKERNIQLES